MVLDAFSLLIAGPVCEEAEVPMDHGYGRHHVASDAESGDATEKAENQADAAEEFGTYGQEGQRRRDVRLLGEESHGARESIAAKPAEGLLRPLPEKDHANDTPKAGASRAPG